MVYKEIKGINFTGSNWALYLYCNIGKNNSLKAPIIFSPFVYNSWLIGFHLKKINNENNSSLGIAPTRNCTHFLKIVFVFAGGGFLFLLYPPKNKSDKVRIFFTVFCIQKRFNTFSKRWVQFRVVAITFTENNVTQETLYIQDLINITIWVSYKLCYCSKTLLNTLGKIKLVRW